MARTSAAKKSSPAAPSAVADLTDAAAALPEPASTAAAAHARVALCQRWLAVAAHHMRLRLVTATQVRQARAAGLTEDEAWLSVEQTQQEVEELARQVAAVEAEARDAGVLLPIEVLLAQAEADELDRQILVLAVAPHIDVDIRDAIARFNDNLLANYVDVRLCLEFLSRDPVARLAMRARFLPEGALRRARLIALERRDAGENLLGQEVVPVARAMQLLLGDEGLLDTTMSELAVFVRPEVGLDQVVLPDDDLGPLVALLEQHVARGKAARKRSLSSAPFSLPEGLVVEVSGPPGTGKTMLVHALAKHIGKPVLEVDAQRLQDSADVDFRRNLHSALDQARLADAVVVLDGVDGLLAKGAARVGDVQDMLRAHPGITVLTSRESANLDANLDRFVLQRVLLDTPAAKARERIFALHLPEGVRFAQDCSIQQIAGQYTFPGALIRNAMQVAVNRATAANPAAPEIGHEVLRKACHDQIRASLDEYAVRRKVGLTLEDLIVPKETRDDIEEMFTAARHRGHVLHNWGFGQKMSTGKGLVALFSGDPGTGKTLCATILANELDQQLFQIAIPRVVSKWIGETEQNIEKIFQTAKAAHGILLFDEADSLFASRTKVDSSVDRYSNMATNMLLQEIENFEGIVILTTNLEKNIDKAFQRRIGFKIHFPFPEPPDRARIWQTLVPKACPIDPDVDWQELGLHFELSGGHIKNAVLRGAYQAAAEGKSLNFRHLEFAARQECKNAGKVFRSTASIYDDGI
jgi:SpoVK/Ycf46/Vps4 family AAA+-type ATPase